MKTIESVKSEIVSKLPLKYEPLLLTFYGIGAMQKDGWAIIGDDYGTKLCLDLGDGHIQSIDDEGKKPSRFVNSSIDQLAAFLEEYHRVQSNRRNDESEDELHSFVMSCRARLVAIDAAALENRENWWSTILEQMEDGLL